jgi:hypothetical protein
MEGPPNATPPFDWNQLGGQPQDPAVAGERLHHYVEHLFQAGWSEDLIRDHLVAGRLPLEFVTELLVGVRQTMRQRRDIPAPQFGWQSGPSDFGGVVDSINQAEQDRLQRRSDRKARREKSARLAANEPDPTFSLEGSPSYAQVLARQANSGEGRWFRLIMLALVALPVAVVVVVGVWRSFFR